MQNCQNTNGACAGPRGLSALKAGVTSCRYGISSAISSESLLVALLQVPGGAAGRYLLGRIARLTSRQEEAARHYSAALEADPLMWQAFQELCQLGAHQYGSTHMCRRLLVMMPSHT